MKVEIWSDIQCPFCYIGKRKFEQALEAFDHRESVEIVWRSFQLDPGLKPVPGQNLYQYLAERKGISIEQSAAMHAQVKNMAASVGLHYNFEKAIVANSFDAHRVIHLAQENGLGNEAEEAIFNAYFTAGVDVADHNSLQTLGESIGLPSGELSEALRSNAFADAVNADIKEAQLLGIQGVPFFVFDRKYAVSGAQAVDSFLEALKKAYASALSPSLESAE